MSEPETGAPEQRIMGKILGVDPGTKRIGLAISDPLKTIARPLGYAAGLEAFWAELKSLAAEEELERIVVGLPLNMDGSEGPKAKEALAFCEQLRERTDVEVVTWDERLTTVQAEAVLRAGGGGIEKRRQKVDALAAQILLQSYLDRLAAE